jgi:hypothetical protein
MALRYGSKNASSLRYNQFNSSVLRYGSFTMSMGGYDENATPAEYFTFTSLSDGTYSIKAKDVTNMPEDVVLPSIYNGKLVTQIGEHAFSNMLEFKGCETIKSVVIPNTITYIGKGAFWKCSNLLNITIPDSVTYIGCNPHPFYDTAYYNDESKWENDVLYIGNHLIEAKDTISGEYIIRDGTITIVGYAFHDCSNLTGIIIPDSVVTIGEYAFDDCRNLANVSIGNGVTSIGDRAFNTYQGAMKGIIIPDSVTTIGLEAFNYSDNFTIYCEAESRPSGWNEAWANSYIPVVWGYKVEELFTFTEQADGTYSVKAKDVSNLPIAVAIPREYNGKAVTAIDARAFQNATNITRVVVPDGVTSIGWSAFYGCSNLEKVVLPEGITVIDNNTFEECRKLTEINLPESLTTINPSAFGYCTILPTITIPSAVTYIGGWAFYNCNALTINCKAASQPSGWDANWNIDNRPVIWGYTG